MNTDEGTSGLDSGVAPVVVAPAVVAPVVVAPAVVAPVAETPGSVNSNASDERRGGQPRGGRPLKMLWVNHHADFVGGCEAYVHNTAKMLSEHGVESTLMYEVPGRIGKKFTDPFVGAFPIVDLKNQLEELQPDVIYIHQLQDSSSLPQFAESPVPVVKFFHDHRLFCLREHKYTTIGHQTCTQTTGMNCYTCMGFVERGGRLGVRFRTLGALKKEQNLHRRLDGFVVGSQYMRDHVIGHGFDASQVHCVPLYANEPEKKNYGPRNTQRLFFAGALVRGKGLDTLLQAMASSDSRLELFIAGEGRQEQLFRDMARELGIETRVHFLGKLNSEQVQEHLATCLCVVFPSRSPETFGLIGLEAMTHGTPVVATRVGGITEWLEHDVNGLVVESGNVEQLADAIREMVGNLPRAIEMGEIGLQKYASHFKPENHISNLLGTIRSIVKTKGASNAIAME